MTDHEPWTPWSIWQYVDLPDEAYERMAQGDIWRVQEPPPSQSRPLTSSYEYRSYVSRIAVYKIARGLGYGKAVVVGQWQGDKEWVEVGYIENTG